MNAFMAQAMQRTTPDPTRCRHFRRADELVPGQHVEIDGSEWVLQAVRLRQDVAVLVCGGRWNPSVPCDQMIRVLR
jgi:hypothetical protein